MGNVANFLVTFATGYFLANFKKEEKNVRKAGPLRRVGCFNLVRKMYLREGYSFKFSKNMFSSKVTVFFIPTKKKRVSSTISVFADSLEGLPADAIYKEEIDVLRTAGNKIAEVGKFASIGGAASGLFSEVEDLMAEVLRHSIESKIDHLCITVNPKHRNFYRHMGFDVVGRVKNLPAVSAPAVFMTVNVNEWLEKRVGHQTT